MRNSRTFETILPSGFCLLFITLMASGLCRPAAALDFQQFYSFSGGPANPAGGLIQGSDGNFYGTTIGGGSSRAGTIYRVTPGGTLTTLGYFLGNGLFPRGTMVRDDLGNFYGTASAGYLQDAGVVFKLSTNGTQTILHHFDFEPGSNPYGGLIRGNDGNFYGTTENFGTVFKITPAGVFTTISSVFGTRGLALHGTLAQATNGTLYGVAGREGFSDHGGIVFALDPVGGLITPIAQFPASARP